MTPLRNHTPCKRLQPIPSRTHQPVSWHPNPPHHQAPVPDDIPDESVALEVLLQNPGYITLFVYGTLKRGLWNHDHFCRHAIDIRSATVRGRLYHLPAGYPALQVPASAILAHGTADPIADAATQTRHAAQTPPQTANHSPCADRHLHPAESRPNPPFSADKAQSHPSTDWNLIHGELITFPDPIRDLPPLDRLEGYHPNQPSHYHRILTHTTTHHPAWLYIMQDVAEYPNSSI